MSVFDLKVGTKIRVEKQEFFFNSYVQAKRGHDDGS